MRDASMTEAAFFPVWVPYALDSSSQAGASSGYTPLCLENTSSFALEELIGCKRRRGMGKGGTCRACYKERRRWC